MALLLGIACAQECDERHPADNAWWVGPLIANSAATLPRGHALLESYIFDNTVQGRFLPSGARRSAPHSNGFGSLSYIVYSLNNKTSLGVLPAFGFNQPGGEPGIGDWTLQAQRRILHFDPCRSLPTVSLAVQQTLPTGRFDHLGANPAAGLGSGAFTTNLALFTQTWLWLPNRRIVRMRVNLGRAASSSVPIEDASVYGTADGFRGTAHPGGSLCFDAAWEYSLTRRWVLAADLIYHSAGNTRVSGTMPSGAGLTINSGPSRSWAYAPAVEYSWKPWMGVIVGTRVVAAGQNASATIMPAIGLNFVH